MEEQKRIADQISFFQKLIEVPSKSPDAGQTDPVQDPPAEILHVDSPDVPKEPKEEPSNPIPPPPPPPPLPKKPTVAPSLRAQLPSSFSGLKVLHVYEDAPLAVQEEPVSFTSLWPGIKAGMRILFWIMIVVLFAMYVPTEYFWLAYVMWYITK